MLRKKDDPLKSNNGNFNTKIKLTKDALFEAKQWKRNTFTVFKPIKNPELTKTIYIDALYCWGASYKHESAGGAWPPDKQQLHNKILELKTTVLALKTFARVRYL